MREAEERCVAVFGFRGFASWYSGSAIGTVHQLTPLVQLFFERMSIPEREPLAKKVFEF